jgi:hypothetical protein
LASGAKAGQNLHILGRGALKFKLPTGHQDKIEADSSVKVLSHGFTCELFSTSIMVLYNALLYLFGAPPACL